MKRDHIVNMLLGPNTLTLKRKSISLRIGSGQVLVGLLDFKSSDGQTMSVVGSIPMHFRQFRKQTACSRWVGKRGSERCKNGDKWYRVPAVAAMFLYKPVSGIMI